MSGRGPFDRAGSLADPLPGEHYRVVLAEGWCGPRKNSRMDAYDRVDQLRDLAGWSYLADEGTRPIGVVRVIPQTSSLAERVALRRTMS